MYNISMEQKKFKYIISPENTYILDYGEFHSEITGAEIMSILYREKYLDYVVKTQDEE